MADFGRTAEGRKVSDWPKIFRLKMMESTNIDILLYTSTAMVTEKPNM